MSLSDVTPDRGRKPGPKCAVARLYRRLNADDAGTLRGWLLDGEVTTQAIWRALTDEGVWDHSSFPLARHRKLECQCGEL